MLKGRWWSDWFARIANQSDLVSGKLSVDEQLSSCVGDLLIEHDGNVGVAVVTSPRSGDVQILLVADVLAFLCAIRSEPIYEPLVYPAVSIVHSERCTECGCLEDHTTRDFRPQAVPDLPVNVPAFIVSNCDWGDLQPGRTPFNADKAASLLRLTETHLTAMVVKPCWPENPIHFGGAGLEGNRRGRRHPVVLLEMLSPYFLIWMLAYSGVNKKTARSSCCIGYGEYGLLKSSRNNEKYKCACEPYC